MSIQQKRNIQPDEFQEQAIEYLKGNYDVLVSAPTGSGKTFIAEVRIAQMLEENKRVWYASPLKALSNDKYRDFRNLFSPENVGILTGDRKENTKAPILVGTTEIFRNILIEEGINSDIDVSLIVLDEAHWIKDKERGVSWEETIIFSPKKAQLLLLSATFPNIEEIALWISKVREKEVKVVYKLKRPVPLIWYSIGKDIRPLFRGQVSDELTKIRFDDFNRNETEFSLIKAIKEIEKNNMFPAIFFVNSRKEAEESVKNVSKFIKDDKIEERERFCEKYYEIFPYVKGDEFLRNFIMTGIAPHHAGLLPALKIIFEDALKIGLAKFIFATKTLASGIDVPAKSVVITSQRTFDGQGERMLLPSELFQMAGRAGRRGKDEVGYVFIAAPITEKTKELFKDLEDIKSSFYINPHLVLNLLKKFGLEECISFIRKNLKFFEIENNFQRWQKKIEKKKEELNELNERFLQIRPKELKCSPQTNIIFRKTKGNIIDHQIRQKKLEAKRTILQDILKSIEKGNWNSNANLEIGKTFLAIDKRNKLGILKLERANEKLLSFSTREGNRYTNKFNFTILCSTNESEDFIKNEILIHFPEKQKDLSQLKAKITKLISTTEKIIRNIEAKNRNREVELLNSPCKSCQAFNSCSKISSDISELEEDLQKLEGENPDSVEKEFKSTLEFLRIFGYLDDKYFLTEKGWEASKLKNPRSIYIFESLVRGKFGDSPEDFAATTSLVLSEPKPPFEKPPKGIEDLFRKIYHIEVNMKLTPKIIPVRTRSGKLIFLDGKIYRATYMWAKGASIDEVEEETEIEPGDFARNIIQTVEVLRQIENIYRYKEISQEAISKIYKSPISDFVE